MILADTNNFGSLIIILFLIVLGLVIFFKIYRKIKKLKLDCVTVINGGVKCGKTTLAVYLAWRNYNKNLRRWRFRTFFQKILRKDLDEKPLFYSNIPVGFDYVPLNFDLVLREKFRFSYKSVVLISEASLFAGSMDYTDDKTNDALLHFIKLFGHETHSGSLYFESQNISDTHYSLKRSINRYLWIHSIVKWIPFFIKYNVREMLYSDSDNNISNVFNSDVDDTTKFFLVNKRIWKKFDQWCYSGMTDDLPVYDKVVDGANLPNLKTKEVLRIKTYLQDKKLLEKKLKAHKEVADNEIR